MLDFTNKRVLLAPMAGVNDPVFRAICKRMGAGITYSEMISSKGLAYKNKKTFTMLETLPEERPFAVQLFGYEPEVMAAQARSIEDYLRDDLTLIDINMGCPARKVASAGSGAALLKDPALAKDITAAVSAAVKVPVTVKMRLLAPEGSGEIDAPESYGETLAFAQDMVDAGAAAITIHGRTAGQMYKGSASKEIVALMAADLSVPVIASGDVFCAEDIKTYCSLGAAAVMAARGARGNPWIFSNHVPNLSEIIEVAREHTERLYAWEPHKLVWMRKHLAWYFKGTPCALKVRKAVQTATTLADYLEILEAAESCIDDAQLPSSETTAESYDGGLRVSSSQASVEPYTDSTLPQSNQTADSYSGDTLHPSSQTGIEHG